MTPQKPTQKSIDSSVLDRSYTFTGFGVDQDRKYPLAGELTFDRGVRDGGFEGFIRERKDPQSYLRGRVRLDLTTNFPLVALRQDPNEIVPSGLSSWVMILEQLELNNDVGSGHGKIYSLVQHARPQISMIGMLSQTRVNELIALSKEYGHATEEIHLNFVYKLPVVPLPPTILGQTGSDSQL